MYGTWRTNDRMNLGPILLAVLAANALLVCGAGTAAADGAADGGGPIASLTADLAYSPADVPFGTADVEFTSSDVGCADGAGLCGDGEAELPETLPEAIGHLLTLLGGIAEALPSSLGDAVLRLV